MNGLTTRGLRMATGALALACLAACGGGGGGNKDADASASATTTATVSGVASKGLMKNAIVKAFKLETNGSIGAQLGKTVRTDATGHYSIVDLPAGITLLIEVSVDDGTRMADEATGTELTPPAGFKLRAAKVLGGGAHLVQVTPFSEMAVATAVANGGLTADLVEAANQKVVSFANYAVLSTEPTFDAANKPTNPAAVSLAAVSQLAKNGDLLACKTKTVPAEKVACVVAELSAHGASDDAIAASLEAAKQLAKAGYTGDAVPPVVKQPLQLATSGVKNAITEAKTLIRNVRSNADASVANAMKDRLGQLADKVRANVSPIDDSNQFLLLAIAKTTGVLLDPQHALGTFPAADFMVKVGIGHETTCSLFSDDKAQTKVNAGNYTQAKAIKCMVKQSSAYEFLSSASSLINTRSDFSHEIVLSKTAVAGQIQAQTRVFKQTTTYVNYRNHDQNGLPRDTTTVSDLVALSPVLTSLATVQQDDGSVMGLTLKGDLAPGADRTGVLEDKVVVDLAASSQALSATLTRLNAQGRLTAIKNGVANASVTLLPGSYVQARTLIGGDAGSGATGEATDAAVHLALEGALPDGSKLVGTLEIGEFVISTARTGPKKALFQGELKQANGELLFRGAFAVLAPVDPVIASNHVSTVFAGWEAHVEGLLPVPSRPDIAVNVALAIPGNATDTLYQLAGSYQQGQDKVLISGLVNARKTSDEWLTLSTPSGLTVTARHGQQIYQIKKDSALIGEFNESSGKIIFADNSYEQF